MSLDADWYDDLKDKYRALEAENADLRSKLQAAEGRIARAREEAQAIVAYADTKFAGDCAERERVRQGGKRLAAKVLLTVLDQPANAEGIASEGGSAQAANPREVPTDAPSVEAVVGILKGYERIPWEGADQTDWQALAGELAEGLGVAGHAHLAHYDAAVVATALARYHEAIAQHGGEGS